MEIKYTILCFFFVALLCISSCSIEEQNVNSQEIIHNEFEDDSEDDWTKTICGDEICDLLETCSDCEKDCGRCKEKNAIIIFKDNVSNCVFDGNVFVDDILIGKTTNGEIEITKDTYNKMFKFNSSLVIIGNASDCFKNDSNLTIFEKWFIYSLDYYFENKEYLLLETNINLRNPQYHEQMSGFIRPNETDKFFDSVSLDGKTTEEALDRIGKYTVRYYHDYQKYNVAEYWRTPKETLKENEGDCEDWAIAILSVIKKYNYSLKCYDVVWSSHASVMCYYDNTYYFYDQGRTKYYARFNSQKTEEEKKNQLRNTINAYFESYGIKPKERKVNYAFDDKTSFAFENFDEFIDWMLTLSN